MNRMAGVIMESLAIAQFSIGMFAGVMTLVGCVPQIRTMIKNQSAKDVSWGLIGSWLACSVAWVVYAVLMIIQGLGVHDYLPPLLFNVLTIVAIVVIAWLKYCYDNMQHNSSYAMSSKAGEIELSHELCLPPYPTSDLFSSHSSCAQGDLFLDRTATSVAPYVYVTSPSPELICNEYRLHSQEQNTVDFV